MSTLSERARERYDDRYITLSLRRRDKKFDD